METLLKLHTNRHEEEEKKEAGLKRMQCASEHSIGACT